MVITVTVTAVIGKCWWCLAKFNEVFGGFTTNAATATAASDGFRGVKLCQIPIKLLELPISIDAISYQGKIKS